MTRKGFVAFSIAGLFALTLLYGASLSALGTGLMPDPIARLALPVLIILGGIGMGVVTMLRARSAQLSGLWGFLAMILTVQTLALIATIVIAGEGASTPLGAALSTPALWLLVSFAAFLLLVPDWAGPRALDLGLSAVAALAAIIVIAVGYSLHAGSGASDIERTIAGVVEALPYVDWIALGIFVTALAGVLAGRFLPEAQ